MTNELIFSMQNLIIITAILVTAKIGKEALVAVISALFLFANIFISKEITLFSLEVTSADVYIIGAVLGLSLLQKLFDEKIAKQTIIISFFINFLLAVVSILHLQLIPTPHDSASSAFDIIFNFTPRVVIASLVAHLLAQHFQIFLFSISSKFNNFFIQNLFAVTISQFLDTALFTTLALYGKVHNLLHIFFLSSVIKIITIIFSTPFLSLANYLLTSKKRN